MKAISLSLLMLIFLFPCFAQEESDMPGQDFDLEALPGIIEGIETWEDLEKAINDSSNNVNNLDLDGDGVVDYVLIQETSEGNTHVVFLRIATGEDEYQDIATIEIEKKSSAEATLQIVGDEALYGKDYILEPEGGIVDISDGSGSSGGQGGPYKPFFNSELPPPAIRVTICVNIFRPGYRVFISPWGFRRHPVWFRPWRPMPRHVYRKHSARWHRKSFRRTSHRRSMKASNMHKKHRRSSPSVHGKKTGHPSKAGPATSPSTKKGVNKSQQQKKNQQQKKKQQQQRKK